MMPVEQFDGAVAALPIASHLQHRPCCIAKRKRVTEAKTFQCHSCRHQATLTSGTIFHSSKLPLTKWFQEMYFLTQSKNNVSALELMGVVGVCYRTVWRLKHKILDVMAEREPTRKLEGRVEVDDAYLGGAHPRGEVWPGIGEQSAIYRRGRNFSRRTATARHIFEGEDI